MNRKLLLMTVLMLVSAGLIECDSDDSYPMDDILKLELIETENMKADGEYQFTVKAKLPANASEDYKTVTFTSGSGKFVTSNKESIEKQIDSEGIAEVSLVVGTEPGTYYVTASIGSEDPKYSVSRQFTLGALTVNEIIKLTISDTLNIRADGDAVIKLDITIDNTPLNVVTMSSNEGFFLGSDKDTDNVKVDQSGAASFRLQVGNHVMKYYIVTSISEGFRVISEVNVRRAYGQSMLIETGSLTVDAESPVSITVFLKRVKGKVSADTPVFFEAYQLNDSNVKVIVGRFTGISNATDDEGKVTVSYYADSENILTDRPIHVRVTTPKETTDTILEGEVELIFQP